MKKPTMPSHVSAVVKRCGISSQLDINDIRYNDASRESLLLGYYNAYRNHDWRGVWRDYVDYCVEMAAYQAWEDGDAAEMGV